MASFRDRRQLAGVGAGLARFCRYRRGCGPGRGLSVALVAAWFAVYAVAAPVSGISIPVWIESGSAPELVRFDATINGRNAAIAAQRDPSSDQIILIVLDMTGDLSLIDAARQAAIAEIGKLPENAWVSVMRAQDGLRVLSDPEANRQPAIAAIQELAASGNAGLLNTVEPALSLADAIARKAPVRTSVLYLTDSNIYNYREDYSNPVINQSDPHDLSRRFPEEMVQEKFSKLGERLASLQAPLFVVHLTDRRDRLNQAYENGLVSLAAATGGKTEICRSMAEIPDAIARTFTRIGQTWNLVLALPPKPGSNLQIRLNAHRGGEELRLAWRTRLSLKKE